MGYQMEQPEGKTARAYGNELRTSWKNAINVARQIQGMNVRKAEAYLEDVIALRTPVKFTTRNRKVAHKPGIGSGRYPKKSAMATLGVLRNAINNAEYAGHDADEMIIYHASAYKGRTLKGFMPRAHGRASPKNEDTTNIEIILLERAEAPRTRGPRQGGPKGDAKKESPKAAAKPAEKKAEAKPAEKKAEARPVERKAEATHVHKPGEKHDHKEAKH